MQKTLNLETIEQTLSKQRANLLASLEKKRALINGNDISNPGRADRAMVSRNKNKQTLLLAHVEHQLQDTDQALSRLERGTYGICADCGESIQVARLEIMPAASLCIECQRIQDNE